MDLQAQSLIQSVVVVFMDIDPDKKYTELILVEGLSYKSASALQIDDFVLVDLHKNDLEEWRYILSLNVAFQIRKTMSLYEIGSNPLMCFRRNWSLYDKKNIENESLEIILESDCRCLDITLLLSSTQKTDAKVIMGAFFDDNKVNRNSACVFVYLPIHNWNLKNYIRIEDTDISLINDLYYRIENIIKSKSNSKMKSYLFQVYSTIYGTHHQSFISLVTALDMLRNDTSRNNRIRIESIVDSIIEDESKKGQIKELYDARTRYIHQGNPDKIEAVSEYTHELVIRITREILLRNLDVESLENNR